MELDLQNQLHDHKHISNLNKTNWAEQFRNERNRAATEPLLVLSFYTLLDII